MAKTEKTVILDFEVDLKDPINQLEKLKGNIVTIKKEQELLNKAYKTGQITLKEYSAESVRLENSLKRQQQQYNETQKKLLGFKSKMDELINATKGLANNINIAGVNVGDLGGKLKSFLNPAVAAGAAISGLFAAYARSAAGARDLANAQAEIGIAFDIVANKLFSASEDEGVFTKISKGFALIASDLAGVSRSAVINAENAAAALRALDEALIDANKIRKQTEKEAENARRKRDDDEFSFIQKLEAANTVEDKLKENEKERVKILKTQIEETLKYGLSVGTIQREAVIEYRKTRDVLNDINFAGITDKETRIAIKKAQAEIADIEEEINGKLTENIKARQQILSILQTEAAIAKINAAVPISEQNRILQPGNVKSRTVEQDSDNVINKAADKLLIDRENRLSKIKIDIAEQTADRQREIARQSAEYEDQLLQSRLASVNSFFGALSGLFDQQSTESKVFAIGQIGINSGIGISEAVKAGAGVPWPANLGAILSGITAVLTGIGQAKSALGFAEGGWTGPGNKYDERGIVHADEYVTPKWQVHSASAQPHLMALERQRLKGYADGGLVSNNIRGPVDQQLIIANAIKRMPPTELSIVEFTRKQNRLRFKEQQSRK